MEIRELSKNEIGSALKLVWEVFLEFEAPDYSQQGVDTFRHFLDNRTEIEKLRFSGALDNGSVIGVLAMREDHISLFFVNKAFHRKGIGKTLFRSILTQAESKKITVNSSPYAQNIYGKLGFTPTGPEQTINGIRYIPMTHIYE